ncbi:hypothetical protein BKA56DRAFT_563545 [Ilyonectria sp. MPI-CAGE-AT-0026]|nr:hypothetical protein BKA56DRAFT_563545 [Ilyonectria sp. MPI-CAGE-AT-0026]
MDDNEFLNDKVRRFLEYYSGRHEQDSKIDNLVRVLDGRPDHVKPLDLVPMDELEQRLLAIEKLLPRLIPATPGEGLFPDSNFTALQTAVLLMMPLASLQATSRSQSRNVTALQLRDFNKLFDRFLRPGETPFIEIGTMSPLPSKGKGPAGSGPSTPARQSTAQGGSGQGETQRDRAERDKCYNQDHGRCVVTGLSNPHVCHIIPYTWNNTAYRHQRASWFTLALTLVSPRNPYLHVLQQGIGSSDKAWNMVSLSPLLHFWWLKGFFAFKCMGITPVDGSDNLSEITLQFRWMPRSPNPDASRFIKQDEQPDANRDFLSKLTHYYSDACGVEGCIDCPHTAAIAAHNIETDHRIVSGDLIKVRRNTDVAERFKSMIDIQWALICAAAMSGAAQAPELLGVDDVEYYEDDGDEDQTVEGE